MKLPGDPLLAHWRHHDSLMNHLNFSCVNLVMIFFLPVLACTHIVQIRYNEGILVEDATVIMGFDCASICSNYTEK